MCKSLGFFSGPLSNVGKRKGRGIGNLGCPTKFAIEKKRATSNASPDMVLNLVGHLFASLHEVPTNNQRDQDRQWDDRAQEDLCP